MEVCGVGLIPASAERYNSFTRRINELSPDESAATLTYLYDHISQNHDLQVRFRWEPNSVAIWDNRSAWRMYTSITCLRISILTLLIPFIIDAITKDFEDDINRVGHRAVSIGETPYFDPASVGRREGLSQRAEAV